MTARLPFTTHPTGCSVVCGGIILLSLISACNEPNPVAPIIAGYVEHVCIANGAFSIQAKLDTGANSSSINAARSQQFDRDGQQWVRINLTNRLSESLQIEAPVKKTIRIRRAGTQKERRLVIDLQLSIGGYSAVTEVSLANRTGQSYQLLIGRKFLADKVLVRSSDKFLLQNRC